MLIGYARVSTRGQDLAPQIEDLHRLGVDPERIYVDHGASGRRTTGRPGYAAAMQALRPGDTLVVTKLDRLGRNHRELRTALDRISGMGARLSEGGKVFDPADERDEIMFTIMALYAQLEAGWARDRTLRALQAKRDSGASLGGGQPALSARQQRDLVAAYARHGPDGDGTLTQRQLAVDYGVTPRTVARYLARHRHTQTEETA